MSDPVITILAAFFFMVISWALGYERGYAQGKSENFTVFMELVTNVVEIIHKDKMQERNDE